MDKVKVNFDMGEFERPTKLIQDKNGNDVVIWNWIPFEEKEAFVQELITFVLNANDELGICYEAMNYDLFYNYEIIKHYTNIDVDGIQDIDGFRKLYDYCDLNGIQNELNSPHLHSSFTAGGIACENYNFLEHDLGIINKMIQRYYDAIKVLYEAEHSLGNMVKKILDTDVDTNNKETRELIEKLIDMKGALMEKEEKGKVLAFGKKKSVNVETGGAKMNLAKR